jgi:hypothetical protein
MPEYQVTCITRDGSDPDWRIDSIGFSNQVFDIDEVITRLRASSQNRLWVNAVGTNAWVGIRRHPTSQRDYLATEPDGYPLNHLSNLKDCPSQ